MGDVYGVCDAVPVGESDTDGVCVGVRVSEADACALADSDTDPLSVATTDGDCERVGASDGACVIVTRGESVIASDPDIVADAGPVGAGDALCEADADSLADAELLGDRDADADGVPRLGDVLALGDGLDDSSAVFDRVSVEKREPDALLLSDTEDDTVPDGVNETVRVPEREAAADGEATSVLRATADADSDSVTLGDDESESVRVPRADTEFDVVAHSVGVADVVCDNDGDDEVEGVDDREGRGLAESVDVTDGDRDTLEFAVDECDTVSVTLSESVGVSDDDSHMECVGVPVSVTSGEALGDGDDESDGECDGLSVGVTDTLPVREPVGERLDDGVTRTTVFVTVVEREAVGDKDACGDLEAFADGVTLQAVDDRLPVPDTGGELDRLLVADAVPETVAVPEPV
jgi:hypothetical protein